VKYKINCKYRSAATLHTLEIWFVACVIVNTLHKGITNITIKIIIIITRIRMRRRRRRYTKTGCYFPLHPSHASSTDPDR